MTSTSDNNFNWDANRQILDVVGRLLLGGIVGPFFSLPGQGIIYYDANSENFMASKNGGAPFVLGGGGGGTANQTAQTNGVSLPQEPILNLIGNALSGTDVPGVKTNITLSESPNSASVVGTGRLINTTAPLTGGGDLTSDLTLAIPQANSSTNGFLSSADWTAFNSKLSTVVAGTGITVTGGNDVSISNTAVTPGSYTFASITINAQGQITAASSGSPSSGTVTSVAMTGDGTVFNTVVPGSPVTTSGTLAPALHTQANNTVLAGPTSGGPLAPTFRALANSDLPLSGVSAGSYTNTNLTVNSEGIITAASNGAGGGGGTDISARVRSSVNQAITTNAVVALTFDTTVFDTDTMSGVGGANPTRLTCHTAGKFIIHGLADLEPTANSWVFLSIMLNGATTLAMVQQPVANGSFDTVLEVSTLYNLSPGDYVELNIEHNSGITAQSIAQTPYANVFELVRQPG